mmetsp:Transcript_19151/g.25263  ORF Transcript_19151/g.25263 Transcript_19151/m.25263 type:complete len:80 (-) Transcript_19151:1016-1255(-)
MFSPSTYKYEKKQNLKWRPLTQLMRSFFLRLDKTYMQNFLHRLSLGEMQEDCTLTSYHSIFSKSKPFFFILKAVPSITP